MSNGPRVIYKSERTAVPALSRSRFNRERRRTGAFVKNARADKLAQVVRVSRTFLRSVIALFAKRIATNDIFVTTWNDPAGFLHPLSLIAPVSR